MELYRTFELTFRGEAPKGSQAVVNLKTVFSLIDKNGGVTGAEEVKGFYAGGGVYKVRFLPEKPGNYRWKVSGLFENDGGKTCSPAAKGNHGIVRAAGTHFEHSDGSPYHPFGTTIYALAHQEKALIGETLETLGTASFNKVRHCVFPKHYDYNHNEPELFAFEKDGDGKFDVNRPCFAFWDRFEEILYSLAAKGIQSDLILFHPYDKWGFANFTQEESKIYLDYLLRRFAAIPEIWWSMANEFDLMAGKTTEDWYGIEEFIVENDPYKHLISSHNCFAFYDFTRPGITHCCVQTTQVEHASEWIGKYQKPLVYDECCYEGNLQMSWGNISGFEMVNRFWLACAQGAYASHGEVFLAGDEVLWWSKGGVLKGESPRRIAFLRGIIEGLPGFIEPWPFDPMALMDEEMKKAVLNSPFPKLYAALPEAQKESQLVKDATPRGRVGDKVFIQYLARHCNALLTWLLPSDKKYRVEVVDVWEMTQKTILTGVTGVIEVKLPGKEGIAVIARVEN